MSLLGTPVYANSATPLWVSATDPVIDGDLVVSGTISAADMEVPDGGAGYQVVGTGGAVVSRLSHTGGLVPKTMIQSDDLIFFTQLGVNNGNSYIQTSPVSLTPTDQMVLGGNLIVTAGVEAAKYNITQTGLGGDSAGKNFIAVGSDDVVVNTTAVTANSTILITRMGAGAIGPGAGSGQGNIVVPSAQIVPGVSFQAFLVDGNGINTAASNVNAEFSWVIIN